MIGQEMARKDGELLTEQQYDEHLRLKRKTFPEMPEESSLPSTHLDPAKEQYGERAGAVLDAYAAQVFRRELNPEEIGCPRFCGQLFLAIGWALDYNEKNCCAWGRSGGKGENCLCMMLPLLAPAPRAFPRR